MRKSVIFMFMMIAGLSSFAQNNELFSYVPSDATTVIRIDLKRLGSKIPKDAWEKSIFLKEIGKKDEPGIKDVLRDFEKTGIDFSAPLIVTMKQHSKTGFGKNKPELSLFFKLKKSKDLSQLLKDLTKEGDEKIQTIGDKKVFASRNGTAIAWNEKVMVIHSGYDEQIARELFNKTDEEVTSVSPVDTTAVVSPGKTDEAPDSHFEELMQKLKESLISNTIKLLDPAESNKDITSDPEFLRIMNQEADLSVWGKQDLSSIPKAAIEMLPMLQSFGGKKFTSSINFENGKIVSKGLSFLDPKLMMFFQQMQGTAQNTEMLRRIPAGNLIGFMNVSLNAALAKPMLKQVFGMITEKAGEKMPFKIDPELLADAFKTNLLIAGVKDPTAASDDKTGGLELVVAVPISNKTKFNQLVKDLKPVIDKMKAEQEKKIGDEEVHPSKEMPLFKFNDEYALITMSEKTAKWFLYNPAPGEAPSWIPEFSQYPVLMNFSFKRLFEFIPMGGKMNPMAKSELELLNIFDQLYYYGGTFENGGVTTNMEFRFTNKDQNALFQLWNLLNTVAGKK